MIACGRLHPNATSQGLQACANGVLMDMTEGCSTCMRAADNNITHCMLPFEGIKCSPCDVNVLRHMDECNRAGLSNDICGIDNLLHLSDQCAACLVLRDEDGTAIDCMPDAAPGQCVTEDWSSMDALDACLDGDESCSGAAMSMLSDVRPRVQQFLACGASKSHQACHPSKKNCKYSLAYNHRGKTPYRRTPLKGWECH